MICVICESTSGIETCPSCNLVDLCSNHVRLHRPASVCFPFTVAKDSVKGRYLVATRDIPPGEIIFEEKPFVVGPSKSSKGLVCLVCLNPADKEHRCPSCQWPMCSDRCTVAHKTTAECSLIVHHIPSQEEANLIDYQAIMPLRCALLKDEDPEIWSYFQMFTDHCLERKQTKEWVENDKFIHDQIESGWRFGALSRDELRRVEGILDVNTIEFFPYTKEGKGERQSFSSY